jgi:hypothetical protein
MEWAVRSAIIVLTAALLLKALRVQDPSIRLAAWTAALFGSLLIPALGPALPGLNVPVLRTGNTAIRPSIVSGAAPSVRTTTLRGPREPRKIAGDGRPLNWAPTVLLLYALGAGALLLRLLTGLALGRRLIVRSYSTGRSLPGAVSIHESADIAAPATLGVHRPVVVLPIDWHEWEPAKLEAVLAHEQSHILRRDPAVQLVSAIHRALVWYSPLSWFLHTQIVRLAEEASDDAALAAANDRASYAEVLLQFIERAGQPVRWQGLAMARYGKADDRINRILDGTSLSRGMTRFGWLAILTLTVPLVYLTAAARPARLPVRPIAAYSAYLPAAVASSLAEAPPSPVAAPGTDPVQSSAATEPNKTAARVYFRRLVSFLTSAPPQNAPERGKPLNRYVIVSGDSMSGSWDSRDRLPVEEWRTRFGSDFVWFRQDGREYIVTDEQVMEDLHNAMAPQREVNRMQSEVNRQQREANRLQAAVNKHQGEVNLQQDEVNRQQREVNDRQRAGFTDGSAQSRVNALQADVNEKQRTVNHEQEGVNREQLLVNREQQKVNDEQRRVSPGIELAIRDILDSTIPKGLARPLPAR